MINVCMQSVLRLASDKGLSKKLATATISRTGFSVATKAAVQRLVTPEAAAAAAGPAAADGDGRPAAAPAANPESVRAANQVFLDLDINHPS